jgi:beta-glucosidase
MNNHFIEDLRWKLFALTHKNMLEQMENKPEGEPVITEGMPEKIRACGEEGIVLLKNDGTLPLKKDETVAVFGRCQNDWFYVGYGSGGDVHAPYRVSFMQGLKNAGISVDEPLAEQYREWCAKPRNAANHGYWGHWPYFYPEMPLKEELVKSAAARRSTALIVIGRAAGEDRENALEPGSYYLTDAEKDMIAKVCAHFKKVVLLFDCGNLMDVSFTEQYHFNAILYVWQLGQESGNAVANVLSGAVNPSGKLTDTIAKNYSDYPSADCFGGPEYNNYEEDIFVGYRYFETFAKDKVLYPFGYGLSYTNFTIEPCSFVRVNDVTTVTVRVKNTGNTAGKEVVQLYVCPPEGKLRKAKKSLCAFAKTRLLAPQESEAIALSFPYEIFASFDDSGITGFPFAFVLEAGKYNFVVGNSVEADTPACTLNVEATIRVKQCKSACAVEEKHRFSAMTKKGRLPIAASGRDLKARILERLPEEIPPTGDKGILLSDVKSGKNTLDEFVAQLSDRELGDLSRGEGSMHSKLGVAGNAGAFGGITEELRAKGIPAIITADGPAGLRVNRYTALMPCGTAVACTWNTELVEELFAVEGKETASQGVDVILSPGMNIHRNPLCGRNFEYYSEDPVVSGKIAAAAVRGIQKSGVSACPKHFLANHQEVNRNRHDSRVSEQALREIYLRNFEICVKEGKPQNLMTSYNKVNGVWSHYNYDLATTILRNEWGYEGCVVTDWWMQLAKSPEFPSVRDNAYRVRAQVDVLMPGAMTAKEQCYRFDEEQLETLGKPEGLTRAELQRSAKNVLRFALTRLEKTQN